MDSLTVCGMLLFRNIDLLGKYNYKMYEGFKVYIYFDREYR